MIAHPRQRLMMHARQQTRFAFELLAQLLIGEKRLFQRDGGIEPLVHRFIYRAHAALAKLAKNSITSLQNCFWCKHEVDLPGPYARRLYHSAHPQANGSPMFRRTRPVNGFEGE